MYQKYKGYVWNRTKDLPIETREDIYSSLWFIVQQAKRSFNPEKNCSSLTWFFRYIKTALNRLINRAKRIYNKQLPIDEAYKISDKAIQDESIDNSILDKTLSDLMEILPPGYQYIVRSYLGLGLTQKSFVELGKEQGCSHQVPMMKFRRAIKKLKARIYNNDKYKKIGEFLDYEA